MAGGRRNGRAVSQVVNNGEASAWKVSRARIPNPR